MKERLRHWGVNRSVVDAVVTRGWNFLSGPLTVLFLSHALSPIEQGYYYLFFNLIALQSFFELGFSLVLIQFASHEWAHLSLGPAGRIQGESNAISRLVSLGRFSFRWYSIVSCLFALGVGISGVWFLHQKPHPGLSLNLPWTMLVVVTSLQLATSPFIAILEGCNQISKVYRTRLFAGILASIALWIALNFGAGLWSTIIFNSATFLSSFYLIYRYRHFFMPFLTHPSTSTISWKKELLPLQWRIAIQGVLGYFSSYFFTPVVFWYFGAKAAGQMGMTWQLCTAVQSLGVAWVYAFIPQFGALIARKDYAALDHLFKKIALSSFALVLLTAVAAWNSIAWLQHMHYKLADRFMPLAPAALLLAGIVVTHLSLCQVVYMRSHKIEPTLPLTIVSSSTMGILVQILGKHYGYDGIATVYFSVATCIIFPWVFYLWSHYRKLLHAPEFNPPTSMTTRQA